MNKENAIEIYREVEIQTEILLSYKKKTPKLLICNNMDGPRGYYAQWNKSEKDKYYMTSLVCEI